MINYRTAILGGIYKIEKAFSRDDIENVSRKELAELIIEVYDTLTEAVANWWDRDEEAENAQKQRILDAM